MVGAFTGALKGLEAVWNGLEVAWIETTSFIAEAWYGFVNIFLRSWEKMKALAMKAWNFIKGLFSDSIDVEVANGKIDEALAKRLAEIDENTGMAVIGNDLRRQTKRRQSAQLHESTMAVIGQQYDDEQDRQKQEQERAATQAQKELAEATKAFEESLAEAKRKRDALGNGEDVPGNEDWGDWIKNAKDAAKQANALLAQNFNASGATGTFNSNVVHRLGGGSSTQERIAKATEEAAWTLKKIKNTVAMGGSGFA